MKNTSADHPDQAALDRIAESLDETLFVVAGAGSGKTRALVTRLRMLVTKGEVPLRAVAAITFTEKAATELRERVRTALLTISHDDPAARAALEELDGAAIGTLHSFAHRLLNEHPIEAGLPPRVEVLDEVGSAVAFEDRWAAFLDSLLDDERFARPLLLLTATGVRPDALKDIALTFNQNWDLVETNPPPDPRPSTAWQSELEAILRRVDAMCGLRSQCHDDGDPLCQMLDAYAQWAERVRLAPDEPARLELLQAGDGTRPKNSPNRKGAAKRWQTGMDLQALRDEIHEIRDTCDALAHEVAHGALLELAGELRRFTLDAAEERKTAGQLEFHDLLVLARRLLRHPRHGAGVRATLRTRYQRILIDEFQDTDPIQVELAVLLASGESDVAGRSWRELPTDPGRLFFVGDPKQSIYRFRRADIELYLEAAERFGGGEGEAAGGRLTLSANHRTGNTLINWLNATFARTMTQPDYIPSVSRRPDPTSGPPVAVLGREAHEDRPRADEIRRRESHEVAGTILRALDEGWSVERPQGGEGDPCWQPATPGDIAVLVPTRLSLPFLEDALTDAGIPYRTESASLVYGSRMVRDLFATLRAVDDPSDELTTVTALRSPLFGCGDDDLYTFKARGGWFDHSLPPPDTVPADHPVAEALAYLRDLHEARHWSAPSEILDRLVRDRRVLELAGIEPVGRARDLWHRIRFVTDQARAWADATGGTLRQYLEWIDRQSTPGARVTEAVLPETDDDAVRIMTVHAAKGLEFPIAIVAGLSTQPQRRTSGGQAVWDPEGSCILTVGTRVQSPAYEAWKPLDEQMAHDERVRLLYVACSRARDHLVVSLHRSVRTKWPVEDNRLTAAELLAQAMDDALDELPDGAITADTATVPHAPLAAARATAPPPVADPASWEHERAGALGRSSPPRTVAATTLNQEGQPDSEADPGLQKRPRDLDLPPWRKGRYGTAIGRAVHGALQVIDLATGSGLDSAVAAQAMAEGVGGRANEAHIANLVRAALAAPTVATAGGCEHWKEVHVAVPLPEGRVLEGYIDLLFRRPDGRLAVVDYKTGPGGLDADVEGLVDHYRMQGASYALAVGDATGEEVAEVVLVFLTPEGPIERALPHLPDTVEEARRLLSGPQPLVV